MKKTAAAALTFLLAAPVQAQVPDAARPVKGSVEAVAAEVEVLILDSKGVPVEGLTKNDFKLFVNGKEMPLDWFEAPPAAGAPTMAAASADPSTAGAPAAPGGPARNVRRDTSRLRRGRRPLGGVPLLPLRRRLRLPKRLGPDRPRAPRGHPPGSNPVVRARGDAVDRRR